MPSADSNSSCYSSSGSSTSSLSSPRVPITDIVQQEQHQLMRIPTTTTTTITPPITQSHVCVTRYKTELCRPFTETGKCKYGDKCQFSHGMKELRNLNRHPKYKTEYCRTFHTSK
jgi:tristetraprolin